MKVFLDTGVLGYLTHPGIDEEAPVLTWMATLIDAGVEFVVPEICDYELRREYVRNQSAVALARLDELAGSVEFRSVSGAVWKDAASLWAECRNTGRQFAPDDALDGDVLLVATARGVAAEEVVIATTNVRHLSVFLDARKWEDITVPGAFAA